MIHKSSSHKAATISKQSRRIENDINLFMTLQLYPLLLLFLVDTFIRFANFNLRLSRVDKPQFDVSINDRVIYDRLG